MHGCKGISPRKEFTNLLGQFVIVLRCPLKTYIHGQINNTH